MLWTLSTHCVLPLAPCASVNLGIDCIDLFKMNSHLKSYYVNVTMFIVIHTYICILGNVVSELVSILQKWRMYVNVYKNMKCLYFSNDRTLTTSVLTFVRFSLFNLMSLINTNLLFMAPRKPLVTLDSSLWAFSLLFSFSSRFKKPFTEWKVL